MRVKETAGVPYRLTFRDLRHNYGSYLISKGVSIPTVSKRLGHASIATTGDIYGHLLPGWQKEAANNFAKAMEEG